EFRRVLFRSGQKDEAGAGAEDRQAGSDALPQSAEEIGAGGDADHGRRLAAGQDDRVEVAQVLGSSHLAGIDPQGAEHEQVLTKGSLEGEDADSHHPRSARRWGAGTSATLMPTMASPRPREALATAVGSSKWVVASTMAFARASGVPDLK